MQVKSRQIWGDLIYTPDSDLVAVLMHLGYYAHNLLHPPNSVVEVRALIKLLPPQSSYPSKARFVKSRAWNTATEGCSFQVRAQATCSRWGPCCCTAPACCVGACMRNAQHTNQEGPEEGQS